MNDALSDAIKEAYALAPSDVEIVETIEIKHPSLTVPLRLVQGRVNIEAHTEENPPPAEPYIFERAAFKIALPESGTGGVQELNMTFDNVDRRISKICEMAASTEKPIDILYRPYLSNDFTQSEMNPPLRLVLKEVQITDFHVSGKASFVDIINRKFPSQLYTRNRFPSLGSGK